MNAARRGAYLVAIAVILTAGAAAPRAAAPASGPQSVPEAVPPAAASPRLAFRVPSLSGGTISSEDFKGSIVVVDVWATWCGPCRMVIPHLARLHRKYAGKGVSVLGLNAESADGQIDVAAVREFVIREGVSYPNGLIDERTYQEVARLAGDGSGGLSIPTTIILGRDGRVVRLYPGYYPGQEKDIERLLDRMIAEGAPRP